METITTNHIPVPVLIKQRCPTDGHTQLYFTAQGISVKCRHCKCVHVIPWTEVLQTYTTLHLQAAE